MCGATCSSAKPLYGSLKHVPYTRTSDRTYIRSILGERYKSLGHQLRLQQREGVRACLLPTSAKALTGSIRRVSKLGHDAHVQSMRTRAYQVSSVEVGELLLGQDNVGHARLVRLRA